MIALAKLGFFFEHFLYNSFIHALKTSLYLLSACCFKYNLSCAFLHEMKQNYLTSPTQVRVSLTRLQEEHCIDL